jgi:hypothetical protein
LTAPSANMPFSTLGDMIADVLVSIFSDSRHQTSFLRGGSRENCACDGLVEVLRYTYTPRGKDNNRKATSGVVITYKRQNKGAKLRRRGVQQKSHRIQVGFACNSLPKGSGRQQLHPTVRRLPAAFRPNGTPKFP